MLSRIFFLIFLAHFLHRSFSKLRTNDKKTINNDIMKNLGHMVASVHKNTNARLILIVCA
jgi:hypothetical protein